MVVNDEIIPSLHKSDQQLSSIEELNCWEEEADSRVIIHIQWSIRMGAKRVIVLSNDSDTLMLLFRYISQFLSKGLIELWLKYGTSERRRMIPVHMWYTHLGEEWCRVLIKVHVMTGNDSISAIGTKLAGLKLNPVHYLYNFGETDTLGGNDMTLTEK